MNCKNLDLKTDPYCSTYYKWNILTSMTPTAVARLPLMLKFTEYVDQSKKYSAWDDIILELRMIRPTNNIFHY